MNEQKRIADLSLMDIICRRINFIKTNIIFNSDELKHSNSGEIKAYKEMLDDIKIKTEIYFLEKYIKKVADIGQKFEYEVYSDESEIEMISGYNNAIVKILVCIDPSLEYEQGTDAWVNKLSDMHE